jgi:hypothetical protein
MRECPADEVRRAQVRFPIYSHQPLVTPVLCGVVSPRLSAAVSAKQRRQSRDERPIENSLTCSFVVVQL